MDVTPSTTESIVAAPAAEEEPQPAATGQPLVDAATADATAREAEAAEASELLEHLQRVRSEMRSDLSLEQNALQLILCVASRSGALNLAAAALNLGGDPAPRPAKLLRGGAVVNEHGLPPLHIATRYGHTAIVKLLLDASAPPTLLSGAGMPPLVIAAQTDESLDALDLLLTAGAPLAMRDDRRQSALHAAARHGSIRALKRLLKAAAETEVGRHKEPIIELRDRWHRTALHWSVVNQQMEILNVLIEAGASVNGLHMPNKKHNKSTSLPREAPLHSAARLPANAAAPLLKRLLDASADPNPLDQFGQTPLHVAAAASGQEPCCAQRRQGGVGGRTARQRPQQMAKDAARGWCQGGCARGGRQRAHGEAAGRAAD